MAILRISCIVLLFFTFHISCLSGDLQEKGPAPESTNSNSTSTTVNRGDNVAGNPAAVNFETGTGALGRYLRLKDGIRLGGLWIGDGNYLIAGGVGKPHRLDGNSLLLLNMEFDLQKLMNIQGALVGIEGLQLNGSHVNQEVGCVQDYNGLDELTPLTRTELYQLWWRQELFDKKLIIRIGKQVPTLDFNNVVVPNPYNEASLNIPAVTSLIYTPIFVNSSLLGAIPGYYNSAVGICVSYVPTKHLSISGGFYDGSLASGRQSGIKDPRFKEYYFSIVQVGFTWELGPEKKPGKFAVGAWNQSGRLSVPAMANPCMPPPPPTMNPCMPPPPPSPTPPKMISEKGARGFYVLGSQRLWFRHPGKDNSGISGFYQFGAHHSRTLPCPYYVGGGFTAFGLVPERPDDTFGIGVAHAKLNHRLFPRPSETIVQTYYQSKLFEGMFLEPVLSYIPNPGTAKHIPPAWAFTARLINLF